MAIIDQYKIKSLDLEVKDLDPQTQRVKVALSKFNVIDSDGDIIRQGAFAKSIQERGADSDSNRKIAFLRHHDWTQQIGKWLSLEEDADYLIGVGQLGRSTQGKDAFLDYQDGIIREHSIGFNFIQDRLNFIEVDGMQVREATEVVLWEGSAVAFGANQFTPTFDVSKGSKENIIAGINKDIAALSTALKNGKGTDERLHTFEMQMKVLTEKYNSLVKASSPIQGTTPDTPNKPKNEKLNINFYKNLR